MEALLEFLHSLLNAEVTTYSRAVRELDDLLPRSSRHHCSKSSRRPIADRGAQAENTILDDELVEARSVVPQVLRFAFEDFLTRALGLPAPA